MKFKKKKKVHDQFHQKVHGQVSICLFLFYFILWILNKTKTNSNKISGPSRPIELMFFELKMLI